ncbi:cytoplasmic tRNA 2-thiolation protein 2 [Plakobranchus ocellatus]|uniref:Cytoplasmic tRNA 2-thiolation protein 2 n=1 Tax=Plakobranchus ocellatus TaxID=259542 RepID=A0AAV3ZER1_9GAST|nr:cytoplasmic tRNA 2-thiolation protein 2 [Plakobranchus ocellatus]
MQFYINTDVVGAKCVKCGAPGVLVTRIHDAFCKSCFQVYVVHKFRSAIGKSKLIRDGEAVLVAFSGGTNSSAMLHLIKDGLSLRAHKKLRFTPTLLHIDETCLLGSESLEWKVKQNQVKNIMLDSGFPSYWTQLEQSVMIQKDHASGMSNKGESAADYERNGTPLLLHYISGKSGMTDLSLVSSSEDAGKLRDLVRSLGNLTAQENFIQNLRNQMLVQAACQLGFSKVLTAENSTHLAIRILSDIAQGRGSQVSLDTGISDERNGEVMFMRPVRELNAKELAMYNTVFGVESVFIPTLSTMTPLASSIERLTESFVTGLQADFPSTVSNIVRTSGKLGLPDIKKSDKCSFCQSPLDTNAKKNSALGAVLFSQQLSKVAQPVDNFQAKKLHTPLTEETNQSSPGAAHDIAFVNLHELKETMCYGCRLSLHAFDGDLSSLPPSITKTASSSIRERQRRQLSGFLLEQDYSVGDDDSIS